MAERLAVIRLRPRALVDWWSFNGAYEALLEQAYPQARVSGSRRTRRCWSSPRPNRAALVVAKTLGRSAGRLWAAPAERVGGRRADCCGPT